MKILLIGNGSRHTLAFANLLQPHTVQRIRYRDLTTVGVEAADLLILSGGHPSVLHHYWFYRKQLELIRSTTKPIIGVCLGFELIARAYGVRPYKLNRMVHGLREISVVLDALGLGTPNIRVWEAHKWAVRSVPAEFTLIAVSKNGPEIIQHNTKPIFACQFHPEVDEPVNDGGRILGALLARVGEWKFPLR